LVCIGLPKGKRIGLAKGKHIGLPKGKHFGLPKSKHFGLYWFAKGQTLWFVLVCQKANALVCIGLPKGKRIGLPKGKHIWFRELRLNKIPTQNDHTQVF